MAESGELRPQLKDSGKEGLSERQLLLGRIAYEADVTFLAGREGCSTQEYLPWDYYMSVKAPIVRRYAAIGQAIETVLSEEAGVTFGKPRRKGLASVIPEKLEIVDHTCTDPYCSTKETYILPATCTMCGEKHVARITKGHSPFSKKCPFCGNSLLMYGSSREARQWLAERGQEVPE